MLLSYYHHHHHHHHHHHYHHHHHHHHDCQVFATRWAQSSGTVYPMAWDLTNTEVPGVNMTEYYQEVCNKC